MGTVNVFLCSSFFRGLSTTNAFPKPARARGAFAYKPYTCCSLVLRVVLLVLLFLCGPNPDATNTINHPLHSRLFSPPVSLLLCCLALILTSSVCGARQSLTARFVSSQIDNHLTHDCSKHRHSRLYFCSIPYLHSNIKIAPSRLFPILHAHLPIVFRYQTSLSSHVIYPPHEAFNSCKPCWIAETTSP